MSGHAQPSWGWQIRCLASKLQTAMAIIARVPNWSLLLLAAGTLIALDLLNPGTHAHAAQNDQAAISMPALPVRGVVRASAQAAISTDLTSRVKEIGFKEGEQFRAGEILIAFDCRKQQAELSSAKAEHREMMVAFESARYLKSRNANSVQDVETARARADRAGAKIDAIRTRVDECQIIAPYDGRVADLNIHTHELPVAGRQLISIVANTAPEIELIVPSNWLTWLTHGTSFEIHLDETGKTYDGALTRLGASVDTVSQTIKVFANFTSPSKDILPGMSGTARFQIQEAKNGQP